MTVASQTFSLTVSTLAAASSQHASRLIRDFMRDEGQFVPSIALVDGVVLALASIALLVYFIHHIAESIPGRHRPPPHRSGGAATQQAGH